MSIDPAYVYNAVWAIIGFVVSLLIAYARSPKEIPFDLDEVHEIHEEEVAPVVDRMKELSQPVTRSRKKKSATKPSSESDGSD